MNMAGSAMRRDQDVGGEGRDVHGLALRVDLQCLTRLLFGHECVAVGEALAPEDLVGLTDIVKNRFAA
jgi:hypothetical protein